SCIDIEPVTIELLAWASRLAFRPSQPKGPLPACPSPISGCDLREVSLPESLRLRASLTTQPSSGKWQLAQAVLPEAEICGSRKSSQPRATSQEFATGTAGGRTYCAFMRAISSCPKASDGSPARIRAVRGAARPVTTIRCWRIDPPYARLSGFSYHAVAGNA